MATALRPTPARSTDPKLRRLFQREIAPHVPALEAERAQGRTWFIITALAFALAILPRDPPDRREPRRLRIEMRPHGGGEDLGHGSCERLEEAERRNWGVRS